MFITYQYSRYTLTVNTVQTDADPPKADEGDCPSETHRTSFTCERCGKKFQRPILTTVLTSGQTRKYNACPRCMTQVQDFKLMEKREETPAQTIEPTEPTTTVESTGACGHFFGYLKKRERQTSFPEECLTCAKMVECLFHDAES
jgi:DNA-directed RNA polymerase subunit RPC12/RpoP